MHAGYYKLAVISSCCLLPSQNGANCAKVNFETSEVMCEGKLMRWRKMGEAPGMISAGAEAWVYVNGKLQCGG